MTNTQPESSSDTGPTSGGGGMCEGFWPTPSVHGLHNRKGASKTSGDGLSTAVKSGGPTIALTSFAVGSPASLSLVPENDGAQMMSVGSGPKCVKFARYSDRDGCWLKTSEGSYQQVMFEETSSERWCETWPRSGIVSDGIAYRLPPLVPPISGTGCSLWLTPKSQYSGRTPEAHQAAKDRAKAKHAAGKYAKGCGVPTMDDLQTQVNQVADPKMWPTPTSNRRDGLQSHGVNVISGQLNPTWVEWLQGFPLGWTEV